MNHSQKNDFVISTSDIEGGTVRNTAGISVGTIKDIVLDIHRGEVVYVVLSVDTGFLNLGSKYFAIPWGAFSFDRLVENAFILNVSEEKLEKSPGFDKDSWPSGPQSEFISEVYKYYEIERSPSHNKPVYSTDRVRDTNDPDTGVTTAGKPGEGSDEIQL